MNFLQDQETPTTSRSTLDARPSRYESTDNCTNNRDKSTCDETLVKETAKARAIKALSKLLSDII